MKWRARARGNPQSAERTSASVRFGPSAVVLGAKLGLLGVLVPCGSQAQPADDYARVALLGARAESRDLEAALSELLARLGLRVRIQRLGDSLAEGVVSREGRERVRLWIDMQSSSEVVLRVARVHEEKLDLPSERRLPRVPSEAILVEQVAACAYDAVESLLASPPEPSAPVHRSEPSGFPDDAVTALAFAAPLVAPDDAPPPKPANHGSGLALGAYAFVSARGISDHAHAVAGGGAALEVGLGRFSWRPSVWLSVAVNAPYDAHGPGFTLETSLTCLRVVPSLALVDRRPIRLEAGIGGGIDVLGTVPRDVRDPAGPPIPGQSVVDGVATAQLMFRAAVSSGAGLMAAADLDYDPAPHSYPAFGRGPASMVPRPWLFRPAVMVGLCVPLAGEGACSSPP